MIDFIVVSKSITIYEALIIKSMFRMETDGSNYQAYTKDFRRSGVSKLGVWIDKDKILQEPDMENCVLNATITVNRFISNGLVDVYRIIDTLEGITRGLAIKNKEWKLQNAAFKFNYLCKSSRDYMELLNQSSLHNKNRIIKETDKKIYPSRLTYSNAGVSLVVKQAKDEKMIDVSMNVHKVKLTKLPEQFGIERRLLKDFNNIFKALEMYLWRYYLEAIFGRGDYYTVKEAEERVEQSSYSRGEKKNMINVLKGIAIYKGIETYLAHIGEGNNKYGFMQSIKSIDTANRYMRMLRNELGINPVTIGRKTVANFGSIDEMMEGLITAVEKSDIVGGY